MPIARFISYDSNTGKRHTAQTRPDKTRCEDKNQVVGVWQTQSNVNYGRWLCEHGKQFDQCHSGCTSEEKLLQINQKKSEWKRQDRTGGLMDHWNLCDCKLIKGSEDEAEENDWERFVIDTSNTEAATAASDTYVRYDFCIVNLCVILESFCQVHLQ